MSFVVTFKLLKLELVLLATTRISVTRATQGSDLAQGVTLTIQTRVVTRPFFKKKWRQSHQSHGIHLGTIKMTYILQKI